MIQSIEIFKRQPIAAYRMLRSLPIDQPLSDVKDPILLSLLDPSFTLDSPSGNLKRDVIYALHKAEQGIPLPSSLTAELERMAKEDISIWPLATRANILSSKERAAESRKSLSVQETPFVLPGDIHPIQVEALASGDQVFSALHIEWMRKLADLVIETLPLDCNCQGFWFGPLLDVLPEKAFVKALKKLLRRRKMREGGWGLAAIYANSLNIKPDPWLSKGNQFDRLLYEFGCQSLAI